MIRDYTPAAYARVVLRGDYAAPTALSVDSTLDGWRLDFSGDGYLAGSFPDGITRAEGVPTQATIKVLYRSGTPGDFDGAKVAEVESAPDGTWRVGNLNADLLYDVIARHEGYNDMILSGVRPKVD